MIVRVSSGELQRKIGQILDLALVQLVTITNNARDRLVMLSVEEYHLLKRQDRQLMGLEDFTQSDLEVLRQHDQPEP